MSNGDISNTFFTVRQEEESLRLPYFSSHSMKDRNAAIELAVVAFHGGGTPIAEEYLNDVQHAAAMVPGAAEHTIVVAPQLVEYQHLTNHFGEGNVPSDIMYGPWGRFVGGDSRNSDIRISFFTAIDQLLRDICSSGNFPNLRRVVMIGQSAGGQFVNRYAGCSPFECVGISFRYIVMNPSTYLYFDDERWVPETSYEFERPSTSTCNDIPKCVDQPEKCLSYNQYHHGLGELTKDYHVRNGIIATAVINRYGTRDIVHLVGENDTATSGGGLAVNCDDMLQGSHRRERGEIYAAHLEKVFGNRPNHHFEVIAGVGHNGGDMITSERGRNFIFEEFDFPVMKTLADYRLIRDSSFLLRVGENWEFELNLPHDTVSSGFSKRPVLAFFVDPGGDAMDLQLKAAMNGSEVFSYSYSGGVGRSHWEAFTHDHLRIGATNTVRFWVPNGAGTMNVSDVILWYQRNIC